MALDMGRATGVQFPAGAVSNPALRLTQPPVRLGTGGKTSVVKLTPWSKVLLEKLTVAQLVKKFHTFY
jgi:hypothetical protein